MFRFIVKRLLSTVGLMVVVSLILLGIREISLGDVAIQVLGHFSSEEQRNLWLEAHGYMDPIHIRYFRWLGGVLQGDFGMSTRFQVPVSEVLWPRLLNTGILAGAVLLITIPVALTLGVLSGMREGSKLDRTISFASILTTSIPEFASAVFLSAVFVFTLGWLPGTSTMSNGFSFAEMVLPVTVLVIYDFGYVSRMTRASMVEVMTKPYVRTAVLKGLPYHRVIFRHALRNALIPTFTVIMLQITWLLSSVIVVEYFFAYKGFGSLLLEASLNDDLDLIEACALVAVVVAEATRTLTDIGYVFLNPRIRFS